METVDTLDPLSRLKEQTIRSETRIQYTIDLTRNYHNLLQKEEAGITRNFLWDRNVAGMTEEGKEHAKYYFQDEMGSPIRLMGKNGELEESYGYDEFGRDLYENQGMVQPFGYTGYQADRITGTYYAQAREYRAELGRFAAVDTIKGFVVAPNTLNEYGYCWNNPMILVDLDGAWPSWEDFENVIIQGRDTLRDVTTVAYNCAAAGYNDLLDSLENVMIQAKDTLGDVTIVAYNCAVAGYNDLFGDLNGTISIKRSVNANALLGIYIDAGFSFDWKGNVAYQWSYAVPGVDDTMSIGILDIGAAYGVSFTDAGDVSELLGKSSTIGGSGGYLGYATIDLISFDEMEDMHSDTNGFQIGVGVGAGVDVHMMESNTKELISFNIFEVVGDALNFIFGRSEDIGCIN